ncbi:hypothetical protein ACN6LC_005195 [Streptomyces violaceoruber]|uniref:Uncharacterized protein n=1 Tax=Streptomyces coelicolor (strain ATCC BAA-471 / A3(2) / M145) TaxID=100226 RepID=Q9S1T5_STRCO|nr:MULTISPECIES: hypothetical protein [Streptomyces]MDX2929568.1 hypothetical protein [Streptomyces sp. NRRL_B-16638]MDX3404159.1 hypothetical protein [Streptomyces sp. ME01-18h]MDX3408324.1 hypothetical protein [Streptomyces sp. ME02-6977A]MYU39607.1 hypothetical protein [Streptomyces sp. SID7813]NSL84770.1 hypothetical protein [Streptomyces coelicolor]
MLWPLPWYLTGPAALAWACLRAREKAAHGQAPEGDADSQSEWGEVA